MRFHPICGGCSRRLTPSKRWPKGSSGAAYGSRASTTFCSSTQASRRKLRNSVVLRSRHLSLRALYSAAARKERRSEKRCGHGCRNGRWRHCHRSALHWRRVSTCVEMNSRANEYARANAAAAGVEVEFVQSDRLPSRADVVIANPPYMMDARSRTYRDGGQLLGGAVALDWVRQGLSNVARGGQILLYTGAAYVDGGSPLVSALEEECRSAGAPMMVEEIDPDVFGEELDEPPYQGAERIGAVGISISLRGIGTQRLRYR